MKGLSRAIESNKQVLLALLSVERAVESGKQCTRVDTMPTWVDDISAALASIGVDSKIDASAAPYVDGYVVIKANWRNK